MLVFLPHSSLALRLEESLLSVRHSLYRYCTLAVSLVIPSVERGYWCECPSTYPLYWTCLSLLLGMLEYKLNAHALFNAQFILHASSLIVASL